VRPLELDFTRDFSLPLQPPDDGAVVVFFPGSTIGNFEPEAARRFLERLGRATGATDLLIGIDLKKDEATLVRAYDDSEGVTAAFNMNLLKRINRELDGDFDLKTFRHLARYDRGHGRIEMHLQSLRAQTVHVLGQGFRFAAGETIHTESSYKYTVAEFHTLAAAAGWQAQRTWTGERGLFSVHLMTRRQGEPAGRA
jgi:dimethylhistidine N-methyltransferase